MRIFKTHLRIVELGDGKFSVQKRLLFRWCFADKKDGYVWDSPLDINMYCLCESLEQAEEALVKIINKILEKRSRFKIVKVIKTVKV